MILLVTQNGEQECIVGVTKIEDVGLEGGSLTKIRLFRGEENLGIIDCNKTQTEILPEDRPR